jgi:hypothetical protein
MKETKIRQETLLGDILGVETKNGVEIMFQDKETNICRPVCTVFYDACDGIRKIALSFQPKKTPDL